MVGAVAVFLMTIILIGWLTPANMHKFDSYFVDYFSFGCSAMAKTVETGMLRGRPFGGVITLINNALRKKTKTIHCTDRYVVTRVANYLFVNVYLPCIGTPDRILICDEILGEISEWCRYYSDCEIVMAGDFNVSLDSCDVVAKRISDFALDCAMCRCDDLFPNQKTATYINLSLQQESHIDYCLTFSPNNIIKFNVLDPDINFSDHVPLFIEISCSISTNNDDPVETYHKDINLVHKFLRWDKADLVSYYYDTGILLSPILPQVESLFGLLQMNHLTNMCKVRAQIDAVFDDIVTVLNTAASFHVPEHSKNFYKFWWTEELSILKEASINCNKLWKAAGKPRFGHIFDKRQSSRLQYRKSLRESQSMEIVSYTNDLHDALMNKHGKVFWKCWRSKFEVPNRCTEVDGCVDRYIIAEKFANHFSAAYSYNDINRAESLRSDFLKLRQNYCGLPLREELNIDTELVSTVIAKLKKGKAADFHGITGEHLLYPHPSLSVILTKLFKLISITTYVPQSFKYNYLVPIPKIKDHKGKALQYDDFRGIAISPIISKVFEYCLLDRCESYFGSSENQFGFKKNTGCSNAIFSVRTTVENYVNGGSTANLCAIDLSKAFDKVNHHALFIKLMNRNIPVQLLDIIINLSSECSSCVKWEGLFSSMFTVTFGVRQGSVLSPVLFAIYIDNLSTLAMPRCGRFVFIFADDIILLAPSVTELEKLLHACEGELEWLDMSINYKKSCCLRIGPRYDVKCADVVSLSGRALSWVRELRYLGVYILSSRQFKISLQNAKRSFYRAANGIFGKIGRIASEEVIIQLIKSKCIPALLYGLEACPLTKSDIRSLDFVINRFFMKLFQTNDINTVKDCQEYFSVSLPSALIEKRTEKFLAKLSKP